MKLKKLSFVLLLAIVMLFAFGCKDDEVLQVKTLDYSISVGEIIDLDYETDKLKEGTTVVITSNLPDVVKVENNKLKGISAGSAEISVSLSSKPNDVIKINVTVVNKESLVVQKTLYSVSVGDTVKIDYTTSNLLSGTTVQIVSKNTELVEIVDGSIVAKGIGEVEVEVFLSSNPEDKKIVNVKVSEKKEDALLIQKTQYELLVGDSVKIEFDADIVNDTTTVVFNLKGECVELTNDGNITALSKGTCEIEVYLSSKQDEKITITVVVKEELFITIVDKISEISLLAEEYTFVGTISDETLLDTLRWSSSNEEVLTVIDGKITIKSVGKAIVTLSSTSDEEVKDEMEIEVVFDPFEVFDILAIDDVLVRNITSYGASERTQDVFGSVSRYSFNELNIIEKIIDINMNDYVGLTASRSILEIVEPMKKVRPGIHLEELKYIIYHDSGNNNPGTDALNHANYMVSQWNEEARARSWHYTVDENCVYHHIPDDEVTWQGDSYDAYAKSIGIETCINYGSDLYKTWQNMGKLLAQLIKKYNLSIDSIRQHYDMSQKNCPQTLRMNNLYSYAIGLAEGELMVLNYLEGYKIEFKSFCPEYLNDAGKVIKQPLEDTKLSYQITITDSNGYSSSKMYFSNIAGSSSNNPLSNDPIEIKTAEEFDIAAATLNKTITVDDEELIYELINNYNSYSYSVKRLITTYDFVLSKEYELFNILKLDTPLLINEIHSVLDSTFDYTGYDYIEIYNNTDGNINLDNYYLEISLHDEQTTKKYQFPVGGIIYSNKSLLISFGDIYMNSVVNVFPSPNVVVLENLPTSNFSVRIVRDLDSKVIDELVFDENNLGFVDSNQSVSRKYPIDTDSLRDFIPALVSPTNANGETIESGRTIDALFFDVNVLMYNYPVSDDEVQEVLEAITELKDLYLTFSETIKKDIKTTTILDSIYVSLLALNDPNVKIVYDVASSLPKQIVTDYKLPEIEGLTYSYPNGEDSTFFDLQTGKLLKLSHEEKLIRIVVSKGEASEEVIINFGIASSDEKIIYNTGTAAPAGGKTSEGFGTYQNQLDKCGFGGIAIVVQGNVYFIGKDCLINLDNSNGTTLSRTDLRPLGSDKAFYNCGIVNGESKDYSGTGALYYNSSEVDLIFDLSDTYGRNNSGSYGYAKVRFSQNENGEYYVSEIMPDSGNNDSTSKLMITLKPGEYLWCPHTFETNVNGGTWLMYKGVNADGGVLNLNESLKIIAYKTDFE